jgi:ABC-type transporter Mla maintaining outer membrane lipid asymmetry ATPase subunit MlaF
MTAAPLRFENIALPQFDGSGVTFEVPPNKAVIVIGTEDSGVDTLASLALALAPARAGRVLVPGEDLASLPKRAALAFRRRVGYLPAGDGLLQNLSLRNNVALPLQFGSDLSDREIESRIRIMLTLTGLAAAAELRPAAASEEQRRRTALARALAFDPELVIMEDPFDGLTTRAAAEILALARGGETEAGSRRTVFMTSQYIPSTLVPRIEIRYRIENGRLVTES